MSDIDKRETKSSSNANSDNEDEEPAIISEIRQNFSETYLGASKKSDSGVLNGSGNSEELDEFHSASEGNNSDSENEDFIESLEDDEPKDPFIKTKEMDDLDDCHTDGDTEKVQEDVEKEKEAKELEARKRLESSLSDQELEDLKQKGQVLKDEGNARFRSGNYEEAIESYSEGLKVCPLKYEKDRAVLFSNRAACRSKKSLNDDAILDCSSAIELHPTYMKALVRRAELYERTEKLDEALKDWQRALELDPGHHQARAACLKLAEQIKERNEKMKEEMFDKLKDLGNMVLRPFGLSTNNFKLQQDPSTGGYSVQFNQNPGNGS